MFSLCIPTMDRFDTFLNKNLKKYLLNELIDEIIITDENGNDYEKIKNNFQNEKLKVFKNKKQLGPFLNKLECCKKAKNEWIVLMDSDNFADQSYFDTLSKYIQMNNLTKLTILAPDFAKPRFDYTKILPKILTNTSMKKMINKTSFLTAMNTGNYVLNKYLIENINISKETENIKKSSSCDVIFFNTLLFEQFDVSFRIITGLNYEHVVHDGSVYLTTCSKYRDFNKQVHDRFNLLL